MIFWIAPLLPWLRDRANEFADFLRSVPNFFAPKPTSLNNPYVPPFTGGQCQGLGYRVDVRADFYRVSTGNTIIASIGGEVEANGRILGAVARRDGAGRPSLFLLTSNGEIGVQGSGDTDVEYRNPRILSVIRSNGAADTCGDLTNPNPPPSIPDDGLFNPTNPNIGDDNGNLNPSAIVLAPFIPPLAILPFVIGAYNAAVDAAKAATDVFNKIDKIVDILDTLDNLFDKLNKDSDDKKKDDPKNRTIVRQTYGQILGDGALDFFPDNNTKFQAIQLDVVITNIPIGFGRYFGSLSPSRYRFRELGYIAFYSVNQGILSIHSIQFKRTSYQIPELAVGFIYHLGLDEQIKGFAFGTFSVEKN